MADSNRDNSNRKTSRNHQNVNDEEEQEEENNGGPSPPDIGLGHSSQQNISQGASRESSQGTGESRRDDNPFSFRHFLSDNVSGGARPKVYVPHSPPVSPSPRIHEVASGLPDFVQDHLVVEQCYLNNSQQPLAAVDLDNIPHYSGHDGYEGCFPRQVGLPEALPDFLSDGPIRSERRDSDSPPLSPSAPDHRHSPRFQVENERLRLESERLRWELEIARRQLSEQITKNETLEAELSIFRTRDQTDSETLARIIEQTEDNLKRATRRAVNAEARAEKLKQEVDSLKGEVDKMRCRDCGKAASTSDQVDNERLASQLRTAANTADMYLRQMLLGVDNLRHIASTLSQASSSSGNPGTSHAAAPPKTTHSDDEEDSLNEENAWGPAL